MTEEKNDVEMENVVLTLEVGGENQVDDRRVEVEMLTMK